MSGRGCQAILSHTRCVCGTYAIAALGLGLELVLLQRYLDEEMFEGMTRVLGPNQERLSISKKLCAVAGCVLPG